MISNIKPNRKPPGLQRGGTGFAGHPIEATSKVPTKTGCNFSDENWWINPIITILIALAALFLGILLIGCGTVIPKPVQANVASYDGDVQNSGLVSLTNSNGVMVAIITPHARDRYNGLIAIFGTNFIPPITLDAGITPAPPNFRIDAEHLVDFMRMNRWHHQNFNAQPSTLNPQPK